MPAAGGLADSHADSDSSDCTGVLLDRTREYSSPLFSLSAPENKPNSHPSGPSSLGRSSYLRPHFILISVRRILHRNTVCPGERVTVATWLRELCSSSQTATVSLDQPPGSCLMSLHGSLLLFYSLATGQFVTTQARNCARRESRCWVLVFLFPVQEYGPEPEVYKPDDSVMKTTLTRNKNLEGQICK